MFITSKLFLSTASMVKQKQRGAVSLSQSNKTMIIITRITHAASPAEPPNFLLVEQIWR